MPHVRESDGCVRYKDGKQPRFSLHPATARGSVYEPACPGALDKGAILAGYGLSDDPGEFFPRAMREGKVELFHGGLSEHMMECGVFGK